MTLQLLISTLGREGIGRVDRMSLPRVPGVSYLVSWQMPEGEVPEELKRDDLKIVTMSGRGLSRNRNNALAAADGDLLMIADDDCHYTAGRLQAVVDFLRHIPMLRLLSSMWRQTVPLASPPVPLCLSEAVIPKGSMSCR